MSIAFRKSGIRRLRTAIARSKQATSLIVTSTPYGSFSRSGTMGLTPAEKVPYGPAVVETKKAIYFYGYELQLPLARLQNWYPSAFRDPDYPGIRFLTMEHYIMYRKALCMSDTATAHKIAEEAATPVEAHALGRQVKDFDSKKWKAVVEEVAETGTWLKYSQVAECREALLNTGEKVLAESNPADRVWAIGFAGKEGEGKEEEWGTNLAGKALMRVRDRLRQEGK